jgi:hypothetical protein
MGFLRGAGLWAALLVAARACAAGGEQAAEGQGPGDILYLDEEEAAEGEMPVNPFGGPGEAAIERKDAVPARVDLSDGTVLAGRVYTTRSKRLKVYNLADKIYEYVPVPALERIETEVEWERMQREWRFKEAGSPEKVYSGRAYPARRLAYRLTLRGGHKIRGHILGQPLYIESGGEVRREVLHKRQKGEMGEGRQGLVYIRAVRLGRGAYEEARAEALAGEAEDATGQGGAEAAPGGDGEAKEPGAGPEE